jgi:hypothetical protein
MLLLAIFGAKAATDSIYFAEPRSNQPAKERAHHATHRGQEHLQVECGRMVYQGTPDVGKGRAREPGCGMNLVLRSPGSFRQDCGRRGDERLDVGSRQMLLELVFQVLVLIAKGESPA